jgi:hypothetical protein
MTLTKNQWIIVGVVALIVIWYFFIRKKPTSESESGFKTDSMIGTNVPQPCNCLKKLPDGSTAYGRYQNGCNFSTNCFPPTTLKDNSGKK